MGASIAEAFNSSLRHSHKCLPQLWPTASWAVRETFETIIVGVHYRHSLQFQKPLNLTNDSVVKSYDLFLDMLKYTFPKSSPLHSHPLGIPKQRENLSSLVWGKQQDLNLESFLSDLHYSISSLTRRQQIVLNQIVSALWPCFTPPNATETSFSLLNLIPSILLSLSLHLFFLPVFLKLFSPVPGRRARWWNTQKVCYKIYQNHF